MIEIRTEIDIEAPAQVVWDALLDFPAHATWNPFIKAISGNATPGQRLAVRLQPESGKGMSFKPIVVRAVKDEELRWRGKLLMPGLFDGEHYFQLHEARPGHTTFVHGERFSGVLVPFAKSALQGPTRRGFEQMNQALKVRAESLA